MQGERDISIIGTYHDFTIVVKCKGQEKIVEVDSIIKFEETMSRWHYFTFPFCLFCLNYYLKKIFIRYHTEVRLLCATSEEHVWNSTYNIILSKETSIIREIEAFKKGPKGTVDQQILDMAYMRDTRGNDRRQ